MIEPILTALVSWFTDIVTYLPAGAWITALVIVVILAAVFVYAIVVFVVSLFTAPLQPAEYSDWDRRDGKGTLS